MPGPVDELVVEFLGLARGGRLPARDRIEAELGVVEFCGEDATATLTVVRHEKLTLLMVGTREETVEFFEARQQEHRGVRLGWTQKCPPAGAIWGGELRGFRPLGSGRVVGVLERDKAALVLGRIGRNCVVVLVEGRRHTIVCVSPWHQLGVVDVDAHLLLARRLSVEVSEQEVSDRICAALRALATRALTATSHGGQPHRGKRAVRHFVEVLIELGQHGCGDLSGRAADIVEEIQRCLPNEVLCPRQLGRVLVLLERTSTVLLERPTPRTWRIRLAALQTPTSSIHKTVCAAIPNRLVPSSRPSRPPTAGEVLRSLDSPTPASPATTPSSTPSTPPPSATPPSATPSTPSATPSTPSATPSTPSATPSPLARPDAATSPSSWRVLPPVALETMVSRVLSKPEDPSV
jgi:hypothetical protein